MNNSTSLFEISGRFDPQFAGVSLNVKINIHKMGEYALLRVDNHEVKFNGKYLEESLQSYQSGSTSADQNGYLDREIRALKWIDDRLYDQLVIVQKRAVQSAEKRDKMKQAYSYSHFIAGCYFFLRYGGLNIPRYCRHRERQADHDLTVYTLMKETVDLGWGISYEVSQGYPQLPEEVLTRVEKYFSLSNRVSSKLSALITKTEKIRDFLLQEAGLFLPAAGQND
ncbi:hypothetical protein J4421_03650 [Candidatus Woesearchaeota archaeon]|nr:hypothetical protein [Candidatus Woesearchaeota archaeon]